MKVRVLYFAALREQRGCAEEWIEISESETLGEIYARLFPARGGLMMPVACARNKEYADPSDRPSDGDEISFLPPIGGG